METTRDSESRRMDEKRNGHEEARKRCWLSLRELLLAKYVGDLEQEDGEFFQSRLRHSVGVCFSLLFRFLFCREERWSQSFQTRQEYTLDS